MNIKDLEKLIKMDIELVFTQILQENLIINSYYLFKSS